MNFSFRENNKKYINKGKTVGEENGKRGKLG